MPKTPETVKRDDPYMDRPEPDDEDMGFMRANKQISELILRGDLKSALKTVYEMCKQKSLTDPVRKAYETFLRRHNHMLPELEGHIP